QDPPTTAVLHCLSPPNTHSVPLFTTSTHTHLSIYLFALLAHTTTHTHTHTHTMMNFLIISCRLQHKIKIHSSSWQSTGKHIWPIQGRGSKAQGEEEALL